MLTLWLLRALIEFFSSSKGWIDRIRLFILFILFRDLFGDGCEPFKRFWGSIVSLSLIKLVNSELVFQDVLLEFMLYITHLLFIFESLDL